MAVALLALLIAASGAAVATIPQDGTITACYDKKSGALRVIDAASQTCTSKERKLAWKDGSTLLGKNDKAADSDKLDGLDSTNLLPDGDLPAGTTLRGHYDIFGNTTGQNDNTLGSDAISFVYTLSSVPQAHFIPYGTTPPPECPGMPGSPEAQPGHLCVYEQDRENIAPDWPTFYVRDTYGFGIWAAAANEGHARSFGTWAVTAPNAAQPASLKESSNAATQYLEP
jgi:hypothetical protein